MKKIMSRLMALVLSFCLCCALIPASFAADESRFRFFYVFDKAAYQVGDTVNVDVMVERTDSSEDFDLYSYSLNALFKDLNLEYVGSQKVISDELRITDTPTGWSAGYKYVVLSYNGLGSHISGCKAQTKIATLTFRAKAKVNGVVMDLLDPSIEVTPANPEKPIGAVGETVIGDPTAATYTVSFQPGGGSGTAPTVPDQAEGGQFLLPQNPYTWDNHTFQGWNDGEKTYQAGAAYTMPGKNVTFTAQWKQDKYQMSFNGGDGTTGTAPASEWKAPGDTIRMYTQGSLQKSGYTFQGWTYNGKTYKPGDAFTMPEADVTFTADWKKNEDSGSSGGGGGGGSSSSSQYAVNVAAPTNGTLSADKKTAAKGSTVTITATPGSGYQVGEVTVTDKNGKTIPVTANNGKYTFTMPNAAVTVSASFRAVSNPGGTNKSPFTDVPDNAYYKDAVDWAVSKGVTSGTSATTFSPDGICTRAQAVTFLWRAAGSPAPKTTSMAFTDVPAGSYYEKAVQWAIEEKITKGTSDTTFSPDMHCSRGQIVTLLWRSQGAPAASLTNPFTDVAANAFYTDAVLWAVQKNVTNGTSATTFSPASDCTRSQIVTFIYRTMK